MLLNLNRSVARKGRRMLIVLGQGFTGVSDGAIIQFLYTRIS
jgi:hypothetical protein